MNLVRVCVSVNIHINVSCSEFESAAAIGVCVRECDMLKMYADECCRYRQRQDEFTVLTKTRFECGNYDRAQLSL